MPNSLLLDIHRQVFGEMDFAGRWRDVHVIVGIDSPSRVENVPALLVELEQVYSIQSIKDLIDRRNDFETIHPFHDGNGRVGGIIVATYSHAMEPDRGWMSPNQ